MEFLALILFLAGMTSNIDAFAMAMSSTALVTKEAFLDISIADEYKGRIILGLFGDVAPRTVENFLHYITQPEGEGYKGSVIHRVVKGHVFQGGDFLKGDGTGEISKFGDLFEDETFTLRHTGAGWLGMANHGPDTNSCQFFVTYVETPWLDDKHVIFGKVLDGMEVARAIENVETDENDKPTDNNEIRITNCGEIYVNKPFGVATRTGSDEL